MIGTAAGALAGRISMIPVSSLGSLTRLPGSRTSNVYPGLTAGLSALFLGSTRSYATELLFPALSPTMTEGNIAEWKKEPGEKISPGDLLASIETDKATLDWEATDDAYLAKILVPAGTQGVAVGTPVAIVVEEEEELDEFK